MKKQNKKLSVINRFPTLSKFEEFSNPKFHKDINGVKKFLGFPQVPEYLKEIHCRGNPFTQIKNLKTKVLQTLERKRKQFDKNVLYYPVAESVSRDIRIKFNANYDLKQLKYSIDTTELSSEEFISKENEYKFQQSKVKLVSNFDFILNSKKSCFLELGIKLKEEQLTKLDKIVETEERFIKQEYENLLRDQRKEDENLKNICHKTSTKIKVVDEQIMKRNSSSTKLKHVKFKRDRLNAECIHLESEFTRLETYKTFLKKCYQQNEITSLINRKSKMDEFKIDAILNELELRSKLSKDSKDTFDYSNFRDYDLNNYNVSNMKFFDLKQENTNLSNENFKVDVKFLPDKSIFNDKDLDHLKFNKGSDSKAETTTTIDFIKTLSLERNASFHSDTFSTDEYTYFADPSDLVNIVTELEVNNLCLIENVQEQEEMCEILSKKTQKIKLKIQKHIASIDAMINTERENIIEINDSIDYLLETNKYVEKYYKIDRYKEIFYLEDVEAGTLDELVSYLIERISKLYITVCSNIDPTEMNLIEMLRKIEILVDSLYAELLTYDISSINKAKKCLREKKILAIRLKNKEMMKAKELINIKKTVDEANKPPRYRHGRKIVHRSEPVREKVDTIHNGYESLLLEEYNFFFT